MPPMSFSWCQGRECEWELGSPILKSAPKSVIYYPSPPNPPSLSLILLRVLKITCVWLVTFPPSAQDRNTNPLPRQDNATAEYSSTTRSLSPPPKTIHTTNKRQPRIPTNTNSSSPYSCSDCPRSICRLRPWGGFPFVFFAGGVGGGGGGGEAGRREVGAGSIRTA